MYFLQISDTHFLEDYTQNPDVFHDAFLHLTPALTKLDMIAQELQEKQIQLSFICHCGDVTHAGTTQDAQQIKNRLNTLFPNVPVIATAGNHDHSPVVQEVFYGDTVLPFAHDVTIDGLRILSFDNTNERYKSGEVTEEMAQWLLDKLHEAPQQDTLLLCHHHCISDQHTMPSADCHPLLQDVLSQPQIKGFLTGHTHTTYQGQVGQIPYYTVASLSFQAFPSQTVKKEGFRVMDIHDVGHYNLFSFQNHLLHLETAVTLPLGQQVGQAFFPL